MAQNRIPRNLDGAGAKGIGNAAVANDVVLNDIELDQGDLFCTDEVQLVSAPLGTRSGRLTARFARRCSRLERKEDAGFN